MCPTEEEAFEWLKFLTLPCHNRMTEDDIDYVIYWVNRYFEENY